MNVTTDANPEPVETSSTRLAWTGMRPFRVTGIKDESMSVRSFWLSPDDASDLPEHLAGQYIPIRPVATGSGRAPMRTYSISNAPRQRSAYRISVKREEGALNGTLPPGVFSNYLHDSLAIGDALQVGAPRGDFTIDRAGSAPICLISAGVGITPVMSMLEHLVNLDDRRPVTFIHGTRNGKLHSFGDTVRQLTSNRPWIETHTRYSRPLRYDTSSKRFDSIGRVDLPLALSMSIPDDAHFFLCGPLGFLRDHYHGLRRHGIPADRIHYENFGVGVDLAMETATTSRKSSPPPPRRREEELLTITFATSGVVVEWDGSVDSILEAAEAAKLSPMYSCRSGICQTCSCRLVEGSVEYFNQPAATPEEGEVLICSSRPRGNIVLDL